MKILGFLPVILAILIGVGIYNVEVPSSSESGSASSSNTQAFADADAAPSASEHDQCVDQETAREYSLAWQDDLASLKDSGELDTTQLLDVQGDAYEKLHLLGNGRYSEFCTHLDELRDGIGL